ncbi:hypothetical protein NZ698_14605 [Chryseobacterium sp. PBS4-4]|uniref:Uncharacterized protein n=1 Tax=Chryseobacterium edaphi TaxID=2976532 RepID=A0ABT2W8Y4_9FLAO|nr:hypothetical protein [Chryseobacterium edaphi]MCU7618428.1 hypothetical protein [Chryseobacterium edaphi]
MKIIIFISILFGLLSPYQKNPYSMIKKDLLYKDKQANIYLKGKIDVASEKNPQDNKTVYLDNILYKDKVIKLKQLVDVATFHQIGTRDKKDIFVKGIFEDKKYKYIFRNHPASSPNIKVVDK